MTAAKDDRLYKGLHRVLAAAMLPESYVVALRKEDFLADS